MLFKNIFNKKNINIEELLKKYDYLKKSAIEININSDNSVSKSYFGGEPLVDEQFVWPYFMTDYFEDGDFKLRPLTFLLQIDCKDLIEFDKDNLLPHSGILSFFYCIESNRWGFNSDDKKSFLVKYFENDSLLKKATLPSDLDENFKKKFISFKQRDTYPTFDDLENDVDDKEYGIFCDKVFKDYNDHHLLGYENNIQSPMKKECELVSNGYDKDVSEEIEKKAEINKDNWILLLQLDSIYDEDIDLMFGDGGRLYFWIKKDDLKKKKFDNVWMILQCY